MTAMTPASSKLPLVFSQAIKQDQNVDFKRPDPLVSSLPKISYIFLDKNIKSLYIIDIYTLVNRVSQ
jgi:hypothetical protein